MSSLKELGKTYYSHIKAARKRDLAPERHALTYDRLVQPLLNKYPALLSNVCIEWVLEPPYANEWELRLAVDTGLVKMQWYDESNTPAITYDYAYSMFRAMHDILNHVYQSLSFSPFDEYRAAMSLLPVYDGDAITQAFVYANVAATNAIYEWSPSRWQKLDSVTDCPCLCPTFHTLTPHRQAFGNV